MSLFDELKTEIGKHPEVQAAAAQQRAVLATARMVYNWRRSAGLSQLELAKAIGKKQESISRIERGTSQDGPKLSTLSTIAEACGQRLVLGARPASEAGAIDELEPTSSWAIVEDIPVREESSDSSQWVSYDDSLLEKVRNVGDDSTDTEPMPLETNLDLARTVIWSLMDTEQSDVVQAAIDRIADNTADTGAFFHGRGTHRKAKGDFYTCYVTTKDYPMHGTIRRTYMPTEQESFSMIVVASSKGEATKAARLLVKGGGKPSAVKRLRRGAWLTDIGRRTGKLGAEKSKG